MSLALGVEVENGYLGVGGAGGEGIGGCDGGMESCGKNGWWRMRRC